MSVSTPIIQAFAEAISQQKELHEKWRAISHNIGSRLPNSTLAMTVQRDGDFDLLLRKLEDELGAQKATGPHILHAHYQKYLSELWAGSVYEVFRLLIDRNMGPDKAEFRQLAEDLRLLRVSLEKHEIPSERRLEAPLPLLRLPANNDSSDFYEYSKSDKHRGHVLPTGISGNSSLMWNVIGVRKDGSAFERWLERRELSDRFISIFNGL